MADLVLIVTAVSYDYCKIFFVLRVEMTPTSLGLTFSKEVCATVHYLLFRQGSPS